MKIRGSQIQKESITNEQFADASIEVTEETDNNK